MSVKKTFGGDRIGTGAGFVTHLEGYGRSTHDKSKIYRGSFGIGYCAPTYVNFIKRESVVEMDLTGIKIFTHPTNGPVFGTLKFEGHVFTSDLRLYNRQLHNNQVGTGLKMSNVKFPMMRVRGKNPRKDLGHPNIQQISQSSLLAHLGLRGLGHGTEDADNQPYVEILRNAMPLMMYWEVYKEYYANKQEEIGYVISQITSTVSSKIQSAWWSFEDYTFGGNIDHPDREGQTTVTVPRNSIIRVTGTGLSSNDIEVYDGSAGSSGAWVKLWNMGGTSSAWREIDGSVTGGWYFRGNYNELNLTFQNGTAVRYNGVSSITGSELQLVQFPLSNIDDMRDKVFIQPKESPLILGYNEAAGEAVEMPYAASLAQVVQGNDINLASYFTLAGMGIKTYNADRFNVWLNKEWVNEINNISSVDTSSGSFTIDAWNVARRIYTLYNRIAVSGGTYHDWLEAVDGIKKTGATEMPVYRGGVAGTIYFDEVVSSSDVENNTTNQPLGTLAGTGTLGDIRGGKVRWKAEDNSFVMVIGSITPNIDYSEGNKWWLKLETMDDIHKPIFDGIGFQELLEDEYAAWSTTVRDDNEETFTSVGNQPSWTQYMTDWNEVYGTFAEPTNEMFMVFARNYSPNWVGEGINSRIQGVEDATTYIDPTKYLYAFAYTGLDYMPFWLQFNQKVEERIVMSGAKMPNVNV